MMVWPFSNRNDVFGLDIGFETLKLVELNCRGQKVSLRGAISFPLSERILEKDHFKDKETTAKIIKEACAKAKPSPITAKKIVSSLPETFVFSKTVEMPKMKTGEYAKAIPLEAAQYLPMPIEEVYLDFQILISHPNEPKTDVLLNASPKRLVDDYLETAKIAGLELFALETKPIAVGRAAFSRKETRGSLITEIGTEVTRISIWDGNKIRLTTTVTMGKNQIIDLIGIKNGSNPAINQNSDQKELIAPIYKEIIGAAKYHQNRDFQARPVEQILLCGSGAIITGIDNVIEAETKIKTQVIKPKLTGGDQLSPEYITAFGLALRSEYE